MSREQEHSRTSQVLILWVALQMNKTKSRGIKKANLSVGKPYKEYYTPWGWLNIWDWGKKIGKELKLTKKEKEEWLQ